MKKTLVLLALSGATSHCQEGSMAQQLQCYFRANYAHYGKDAKEAQAWYKKTFELGSPEYANKGLVHFLFDTNNDGLIVKLIPSLDTTFKNDSDIQFIIAQALSNTGKQEAADERLVELNNKVKTNPEITFQTVQTYLRRKEPENALKTLDTYLNSAMRKGNSFIFHFLKAQIHLQLGNKEQALTSVKTSLDLHPHFDKGWLLHALLEEKAGKIKEAIKGYATFLDIVGSNKEVEEHLVGLVFKQRMLEQHTGTTDVSHDTLTQALKAFNDGNNAQALAILEKSIASKPTDEAKILKIQVLCAQHNYDQALRDLKTWIVQKPSEPLFFSTLHLLHKDGVAIDTLIKTLHEIEKQSPKNEVLPALFLADLYERAHDTQAALRYHFKALTLTNEPALRTSILFQMGLLYYETKQFKKAKNALAQAYELNNQHVPTLNLLSYYYATKEQNFAKAQELINQALALEANNSHILDTQAVIFFKQKQYAKALELLEKLAKQEPQDATIAKHLAKTHRMLGNQDKATKHLQQTIALINDHAKQKKYEQLLGTWKHKKA